MQRLLTDLLAYSRAADFEQPTERVEASAAYEEACTNLATSIAESNATVTAGPLPTVHMHAAHLQQVFQNLIGNAIKYRRPDTPPIVHVCAQREDSTWQFSVKDNGIGIAPEYKEQVFGVFKRLHADEYTGSGLGLAICQRIIEQYRGHIWVESVVDQGSTFIFTIPD